MYSNSKTAFCTKVKLSHNILQKQVQYFLVLHGNNNTECSNPLNLNAILLTTIADNWLYVCKIQIKTRIPSGIYCTSMAAFHQLSTHGQKFDPDSLYEPM